MKRRICLGLFSLTIAIQSGRLEAETFNVTNSEYLGNGSFTQAIIDSNVAGGANTIRWSGVGGNFSTTFNPAIMTDLAIDGAGAISPVVISGHPTFDVHDGRTVQLSNLSLDFGTLLKKGTGRLVSCVPTAHQQTVVEGGWLGVCADENLGQPDSALLLYGGGIQAMNNLTIARDILAATGSGVDTNGFDVHFTGEFIGPHPEPFLKQGEGTLFMEGTVFGDHGGRMAIEQGTVVGNEASLHSIWITNNSRLVFDQESDATYYSVLDGSGHMVKKGGGLLVLTGQSSYSGGTTVEAGTLKGDTESLQGNILNESAVIFANQDSFYGGSAGTYSGDMSGSGSLTVEGNYSLTITGNNSYSGGTRINGSLTGTTRNLQGVMEDNGNLTFDQNFDGAFRGELSGSGTLIVRGGGRLTIDGPSSFVGRLQLLDGRLRFYQPSSAPLRSIEIQKGVLDLGDRNLVATSVYNAGEIHLRTATLATDNMTTAGRLRTSLAGDSTFGRVIVNGPISLGGTLAISLVGPYRPTSPSQVFRIIEAQSISGRFWSIEQPAALSFDVLYGQTAVDLSVSYVPFADSAIAPNSAGIAGVLDDLRYNHPERMADELDQLNVLNTTQLRTAFTQMSPVALFALSGLSFSNLASQSAGLRRRFEGLRSGETAGHVAMYDTRAKDPVLAVVASAGADLNGMRAYAMENKNEDRWGTFVSANGVFGQMDSIDTNSGTQTGYDFSTNGVTIGADRRIADRTTVGLSLGFQSGKSEADFNQGTSDVESLQVGVYGSHTTAAGLFTNAFLGRSQDRYETQRAIPLFGQTAIGDPDGMATNAMLEVGVDRKRGAYTFSPSVSCEYSALSIDSFSEEGAGNLNLNVGEQKAESLRSILGSRFSREFASKRIVWRPSVRLGWEHEYNDDPDSIDAQFAVGSNTFSTKTEKPGSDAAIAGVALGLKAGASVSGELEYQAELGRKNFSSQSVDIWCRYAF